MQLPNFMSTEFHRCGSRLTIGQTDVLAMTVPKLPLYTHGRSNHCAGSPMIFFFSFLSVALCYRNNFRRD